MFLTGRSGRATSTRGASITSVTGAKSVAAL
jgi:hypothetical protein